MISYNKRDEQKLETMMNTVKGILESIVFKQTSETHMYTTGLSSTYYYGQPGEQIKNKIKVARAMLMDIAKEVV